MIEGLQKQIIENSHRLPFSLDKVVDHTNVAISALGSAFFENIKYTHDKITREKELSHPLLRVLQTPRVLDTAISELMELGLYLKELANDSSIGDCIKNLRDEEQYESTFFQLSYAFRFKKIGFNVKLEPTTVRGKSDIYLEDGTRKFIVECYRINKTFFEVMGEFDAAIAKVMFERVPQGKKYEFTVELNEILTYDGMRTFLEKYKRIIEEFKVKGLEKIEHNYRGNVLGIKDLTNIAMAPNYDERKEIDLITDGPGHPTCIAQIRVNTVSLFEAMDVPEDRKKRGSRLLIWNKYRDKIRKYPYEILRNKINTKFKQTKVDDKRVGRVLLVHMPFGFSLSADKIHKQLIDGATRNFENVSAIIITGRESGAGRFKYKGVILNAPGNFSLSPQVLEKLNVLERANLFG